ncbi:uncharacterized protein LOC124899601 [Capsicum annuum]|uniref:uncharacterized protein LOC124899601 n=1 Tax=Capsicum annuum TaxID=4072 RepID=UPI001FB05F36|nr:uncharacterized protein LOC124899601 [Capsicum annuum]
MGMDLTYIMCWRAKEQALEDLRGKPAASYGKLPAYMHVLNTCYPGSHIRMKKNEENEFLYIFIALTTFIQGFEHCRPVIVVDASHLRGLYNEIFVAACTMDGAEHIFPLAYDVLDPENDTSWTWFFENLKEAYGERRNMCVVSDRNANIIKAVTEVYNDVPHYAYVFYSMAKSYSKIEFHKLMEKVEVVDVRVKNYLKLAGYNKWARPYASVHRGRTLTSNITESINSAVVSARELPIYDFLEEVRLMFDLIGKFKKILQQNEADCIRMKVIPASEYIYTVHDKDKHFIVCLKKKKCSCNAFQLDKIPCVHTCAVLDSKNFKKGPYCSDLYKPKTMLRTYDLPVYPLPHKDDWLIPKEILDEVVLPPKIQATP